MSCVRKVNKILTSINKLVNYKRSSYYEAPSRNFSRQLSYPYFQGFRKVQEASVVKTLKYDIHIHDMYEDSYCLTGNELHLICKKNQLINIV